MKKFLLPALLVTLSLLITGYAFAQAGAAMSGVRVGIAEERLSIEADESYPGRYTLFWIAGINVYSMDPLNIIIECGLSPLGRWQPAAKERTGRRIKGGEREFTQDKFAIATIDLLEAAEGKKVEPAFADLFTKDQSFKVKLQARVAGAEGAVLSEQEYKISMLGYGLLEAASKADVRAARELLAKGAGVDASMGRNWTPLMAACASGSAEIVKLLIEKGAQVNTRYAGFPFAQSDLGSRVPAGATPLMAAAYAGKPDVVRLLLEAGAKVNFERADRWTALSMAAYSGDLESVRLLLDKGARINHLEQSGYSPAALAVINGHQPVVGLLTSRGGAIRVPWDKFGD